jgi:hypothetical protein
MRQAGRLLREDARRWGADLRRANYELSDRASTLPTCTCVSARLGRLKRMQAVSSDTPHRTSVADSEIPSSALTLLISFRLAGLTPRAPVLPSGQREAAGQHQRARGRLRHGMRFVTSDRFDTSDHRSVADNGDRLSRLGQGRTGLSGSRAQNEHACHHRP